MAKDYTKIAKETRIEVLGMIHRGQTSHIASCFSAVDLAVVLYENVNHKEDIICWSKGWAAALIYSLLARHGFIPKEDLLKFPNPPYLGLAETSVNGVHVNAGSMGHGLPVAVGMALAKKRAGEKGTVYCIMSDGELNEGTTWESAMLASHHELNNLVVLIDKNGWQAMGKTSEVINLPNLVGIWHGFNWEVFNLNGHDFQQIEKSLLFMQGHTLRKKPVVIIAETIKGKGVKEFSDKLLYHYKNIDKETYEMALKELGGEGKSDVDVITSATQYFEKGAEKIKKVFKK